MRKFTDAVNENETLKTYKFTASIKVEGTVEAHSEGDAGEAADKEIDKVADNIGKHSQGAVQMTSFEIDNIEVTDKPLHEDKVGSTIYIVTAQSFDAQTGEANGESRDEEIDPEKNALFTDCKSILDIHDKYESFWNHMRDNPISLVFVSKITIKNASV